MMGDVEGYIGFSFLPMLSLFARRLAKKTVLLIQLYGIWMSFCAVLCYITRIHAYKARGYQG